MSTTFIKEKIQTAQLELSEAVQLLDETPIVEPEVDREFYVDLQCQSPSVIQYAGDDAPFRHYNYLKEDEHDYAIVCDGIRKHTYNTWLASNKGIGFRAYKTTGDRDRSELIISSLNQDDYCLKYGQLRYLSYKMYIPRCDKPSDWIHFTQVWQQECLGAVPFTISLIPGSFDYEVCARIPGRYNKFGQGTLKQGVWNEFIYEFLPHVDPDKGRIKMFLNTQDYNNPTHEFSGSWSDDPIDNSVGHENMDVRLGIYRACQQSEIILYFDDINFRTHFE